MRSKFARATAVVVCVMLAATFALAAGLPKEGPTTSGTSAIRLGWDARRLIRVVIAPETQTVSVQFKIGTANLGEAVTVDASDIWPIVIVADSVIVTRAVATKCKVIASDPYDVR